MKKLLVTLAAIALVVGVAGPAQAAGRLTNHSSSNCYIQYRSTSLGTTWNVSPGTSAVNTSNYIRIPVGCHGEIAFGTVALVTTPGVWYARHNITQGDIRVFSYFD